jgi:hypothetical protein
MKSLPKFAEAIRLANKKGSSHWEIVRWQDALPSDVHPGQETAVSPDDLSHSIHSNQFTSRSPALIASATWVRSNIKKRTERGHWGVWKWEADGHTWYQTALPVNRPSANGQPTRPSPVKSAPASEMVILSGASLADARRMAAEDEVDLQAIVKTAIAEYERVRFFEQARAAYRKLKADPEAWDEMCTEQASLDSTLQDGLTPEDWAEGSSDKELRVA